VLIICNLDTIIFVTLFTFLDFVAQVSYE